MSKEVSSARIQRLNSLLVALRSKPYLKKNELMEHIKYSAPRTLESDFCFLRRAFNAKIPYSRREYAYHLEHEGDFALSLRWGDVKMREERDN